MLAALNLELPNVSAAVVKTGAATGTGAARRR